MCARCANAYHCKMPAQLPSSDGSDACPEDGVRASNTKIITWSSFLQSHKQCGQAAVRFQEVCRKRMRPCGQGLTHLQVLGSRPSGTSAHFSTSAVTSQVFKVLQDMNSIKPCAPTLLTTSILSLVAGFPPSSFLSRSPQDFHPDIPRGKKELIPQA